MPGEMGMPGMGGTVTMGQPEEPPIITKLRILLVTDKGQIDSGVHEIDTSQEAVDGWYRVAVPLAAFAGPGAQADAKLQKVALFGDMKEYFWLGRIQIVSEDQPLKADAGGQREVKIKQDVSFTAAEQANGAAARYSWDFDDWDGIQEDALGRTATWKFTETGFYTVTLTVTDPGKTKVPQVAHVQVKVVK